MLERAKTGLLVVDYQDKLLGKIFNREVIVPQACRLIQFAHMLGLPVLATEQYPKGLGRTTQAVADELGPIEPVAKTSFGLFGDAGCREAVQALDRPQLVITGIETHVCVMQTVLAALDAGYEVHVPRDAVGSRTALDYETGLARMAKAGAVLSTVEMTLFEILRDAGTPLFKQVLPLIK